MANKISRGIGIGIDLAIIGMGVWDILQYSKTGDTTGIIFGAVYSLIGALLLKMNIDAVLKGMEKSE